MRRVAVIDDDPVEMTILSGLAEHVPGSYEFDHYSSVNAFCEDSKASGYDLVFLDRRVPPHSDYVESLPVLEECGFEGIVVMLTARRLGPGKPKSRLRLLGPYEKLDIQDPEVMEYLLNGRPAPGL